MTLIRVDDYDLDQEAIQIAVETYLDYRSLQQTQRKAVPEATDSIGTWLDENTKNDLTVEDFIQDLKDVLDTSDDQESTKAIEQIEQRIMEDHTQFAEDLSELFKGEGTTAERIERFRTIHDVDLSAISTLLTAYDSDKYTLYDDDDFEVFIRYFTGLEGPELSGFTGGRKYELYLEYCSLLSNDVLADKITDATIQDSQDFIRTIMNVPECRYDFVLRYFFRLTNQLKEFEEDTSKFLTTIGSLPQSFLRDQYESYEGEQKIKKIRHDLLDIILDGGEPDIAAIAAEENEKHDDKNIMNSWDEYKILAQIHYNYNKRRVEAYIDDLLTYLREAIEPDQLSTHYVTYQGATNIPTTRTWGVLYPSTFGDHKSAYQLYIYFYPNEVQFGIDNGSNVPQKPEDVETFESEEEISIQKVIEAYKERQDRFWRWNDELIGTGSEDYDDLDWFEDVEHHLQQKKQIVFHGPPGTGKTYGALNFAKWWIDRGLNERESLDDALEKRLQMVTFHPTFSYEDFIEGITAKTRDGNLVYEPESGVFKEMCEEAKAAYEQADSITDAPRYILIIDEVNRGNIPKIFGETITLIEDDKRLDAPNEMRDELPHSDEKLVVPRNLYIIGTMNTADRSIALVDAAIRRRFRFKNFTPDYDVLREQLGFDGEQDVNTKASAEEGQDLGALSILALEEINNRIRASGNLGKGKQVGHSYLIEAATDEQLVEGWQYEILPLLEEYYFGDMERLRERIFDGGAESLFDWDELEISNFDADDLRATLSELVDLEGDRA